MTDQVENDTPQTEQHVAEPSANESEARASGWVPKEEYHGDENKWVDADEFVRRGPLFEKINVQSRELKEVKKALDQLKAHHANVKETAYKEALAQLRVEKREAFVDGDPDKILEIDDKIDAIKEEQRQYERNRTHEIRESVEAEAHPEFVAWASRNTWYESNGPMRAFADALGMELSANGMKPSEILKKVEAQIKEEFPHKFRNANRDRTPSVEGAGKGSGRTSKDNYEMTSFETDVMNRFVRQGLMTKEQYIAELKKTKE